MTHDVFISHAAKDAEEAHAVCAWLEERGMRCWIAPRDVGTSPSSRFAAAIEQGIPDGAVFVLVFSRHVNCSGFVVREVSRAVELDKPVVPLRLEDVTVVGAGDFPSEVADWVLAAP